MEESINAPVIHDQAQEQPPPWEWLPVVALLGGTWAFTPSLQALPWPTLAAMGGLVIGGWIPFWRAVRQTDWATPLSAWRAWEDRAPLAPWPYLQPGTPGAALHHSLEQARSWWKTVGKHTLAVSLRQATTAFCLSILLSILLGRTVILLTILLATWVQLSALWQSGQRDRQVRGSAMVLVGIPWMLGATLGGGDIKLPALSALALVLLTGLFTRRSLWAIAGPILAAGFLIWQAHPMAAGWIILLALPGMSALLRDPEGTHYHKSIFPWLLIMILCMAGVL
ncbi:MAG: hypothetical protein JXA21_04550 [Anaerolineae bacterium]|nr:hypothetical protein [Anaerolineae bacterium]